MPNPIRRLIFVECLLYLVEILPLNMMIIERQKRKKDEHANVEIKQMRHLPKKKKSKVFRSMVIVVKQ